MGVVYRRDYLINRGGFWNKELTGWQDWEYKARGKMAGGRHQFIQEIVGFWRQHSDDRVGTRVFRPDYVRSVVKACSSICEAAVAKGVINKELGRRLALKIFLHALEFGSFGKAEERREALLEMSHCARNCGCGFLPHFAGAWRVVPRSFDAPVFRILKSLRRSVL